MTKISGMLAHSNDFVSTITFIILHYLLFLCTKGSVHRFSLLGCKVGAVVWAVRQSQMPLLLFIVWVLSLVKMCSTSSHKKKKKAVLLITLLQNVISDCAVASEFHHSHQNRRQNRISIFLGWYRNVCSWETLFNLFSGNTLEKNHK